MNSKAESTISATRSDGSTTRAVWSESIVLIFNNGAPFQIDAYNNPATPRTRAHHVGAYVTDTWTVGRRLTMNLGVSTATILVRFGPVSRGRTVCGGRCIDEIDTKIWNSLAPRAFASYDLGTRRKTVLKGGGAGSITCVPRMRSFKSIPSLATITS